MLTTHAAASKRCGGLSLFRVLLACIVQLGGAAAGVQQASSATVDLVVDIVSDQPAYKSFDLEHFTVTTSNNGPDPATNVLLVVDHPLADIPFEATATCHPLLGPNPNGPAICPTPASGPPSFTRAGTLLMVTIPLIPSQSQVVVEFDNRARCPAVGPPHGEAVPRCVGAPQGNYLITATVSSAQSDTLGPTNTATTNIFLVPPEIQFKVVITKPTSPLTALPGTIVEYEFEVQSFGDQPSDKLHLLINIEGLTGSMLPLTPTNNPNGANGSTLPDTVLQSIDCVSTTLGAYTGSVFPSTPAPWQFCPNIGNVLPSPTAIPIPTPSSVTNNPPVTGFPPGFFLDNLPGTSDSMLATGGVMKFKAKVLVGHPVCVGKLDSGVRNLKFTVHVFTFDVAGSVNIENPVLPNTITDNNDSHETDVPGNCQEADIQFTTSPTPATLNLASGSATWTYSATVTNAGPSTAVNIPAKFEHHQFAYTETRTLLTCTSVPAIPDACATLSVDPNITAIQTIGSASFTTTIGTLNSGASVTFSQQVTVARAGCVPGGTQTLINLSGNADPSPAVFDPLYDTTPAQQPLPAFSPTHSYFINNGQQTIVMVTGLQTCVGGGVGVGGVPPGIVITKSGPFPSAAAANAGTPLIGQTNGTALLDATPVWYKVVVTNTDSTLPLLLGDVVDNFDIFHSLTGIIATLSSGFLHTGTGNTLADFGITCAASPATEKCHDVATTTLPSGYNTQLTLSYVPALHSGSALVSLAPLASLTYVIPFTTPTHTNKCQPAVPVPNRAQATFVDASGKSATAGPHSVDQFVGIRTPCVPGALDIKKDILLPAVGGFPGSIPLTGLINYEVTLSNISATATLDIPHFVDTVTAPGVTVSVLSISCTVQTNGAKCPSPPVVAGIKVTAPNIQTPLPNPFDIDHEWGSVGNNTFPPNSSIKFTILVKLSNPTRDFRFIANTATFSGEHDPNGWTPKSDFKNISPPLPPELSIQKKVSPQIAAPNTLVTFTVTVINLSPGPATSAVFTDALPAALLASNPSGYSNVTCAVITNDPFVPFPKGTVVCPSITSNASGLTATIAPFPVNTALRFTYQALMPGTTVSIDNTASVTASTSSGALSFGPGTAQSRENVQVIVPPAVVPATPIPTLSGWVLIMLAAALALFGIAAIRRRRRVH